MKTDVDELDRALTSQGLPAMANVRQVASVLGCSRDIVYEALRRGELEGSRLGSKRGPYRIVRQAVARWLARHRS